MKNSINKFIVTNFAYGTGPYLRTTELALAFNDELERLGYERLRIIVPLVYGEKQRTIMSEEFIGQTVKYPDEIILDKGLGKILKKVFYDGRSYVEYLNRWAETVSNVSDEANQYLKAKYGDSIKVELNRSPRISYNVAPSYFTSFGYVGEILERVKGVDGLKISEKILDSAIKKINSVEKNQKIHCLAFPGTFSCVGDRRSRYSTEIEVPPLVTPILSTGEKIKKGIFVTVSGIPGLEKLYSIVPKLGIRTYSNNPDTVPSSIKASPRVIAGGNILLHFTRAGWNSVWLSLFSETPLVLSDFDPSDDWEIYFNNISIRNLGIGVVYHGQTAEELLKECLNIKVKSLAVKKEIIKRWGTFDGTIYCAKIFADDYLKNHG